MNRLSLLTMMLVGFALPLGSAAQLTGEFRLTGDGKPIEAELVGWDFATGMLTLQLSDGATRRIPASDLHAADTRLLERLFRKQMVTIRKGEFSPGTGGVIENGAPLSTAPLTSDATRRVAGVQWKTDATDAFAQAQGRDGVADDKPVVWFRVLGDLTGFM